MDWVPLRYLNRGFPRAVLMPLYAEAQVGLVTPLRDGMNLVAKEYVAAQDPDDPGVLVLSQFAGAAVELQAALLINPYDAAGIAAALDQALAHAGGGTAGTARGDAGCHAREQPGAVAGPVHPRSRRGGRRLDLSPPSSPAPTGRSHPGRFGTVLCGVCGLPCTRMIALPATVRKLLSFAV